MSEFDKILTVTDVKKSLLPLVKRIEQFKESVAVTRNGQPAVVILSMDEYEGLLETLEILSDENLMKLIRRSKKELDSGKFVSHQEVWKE